MEKVKILCFFRTKCRFLGTKLHFLSKICTFWSNFFYKNFIFRAKSTNLLVFQDQMYIFGYKITVFIQNLYILVKLFGKNFIFSVNSDPSLTSTLDPLSLRRKVASLSLFYRYYFGHCSDELATCIPPPMARPRSTRQATFAHNYCVELSNARINRFSDGFFPSTSHLWKSLPSSVFPASFNLPSFKRQVYHHLRGQMA